MQLTRQEIQWLAHALEVYAENGVIADRRTRAAQKKLAARLQRCTSLTVED